MRLEVLIDSEEPSIYPLNKNRLIIGSSESSDIIINVSGVSRKHILLAVENDQYSVVDQGSTNGTYINEERLIPGKKADFTSFFPVRLGDRVLLTLLSDDEDSPFSSLQNVTKREKTNPIMRPSDLKSEDNDSTRAINLKQLQQSQATKKLQEQRKKVIRSSAKAQIKKEPDSDNKRMMMTLFIVGALVAAAIYFQFITEEEVVVAPEQEVTAAVAPSVTVPVEPETMTIPQSELISVPRLSDISKEMKCATESEKKLCDYFFPEGITNNTGVVETPGFINIFINETSYYESARTEIGIASPEALQKSIYTSNDWLRLAFTVFISKKLSSFDVAQMPKKNINFILVNPENGNISGVMSFVPQNYPILVKSLRPTIMRSVRDYGISALDSLLKHVQIYSSESL